jgi:hypothetical protein
MQRCTTGLLLSVPCQQRARRAGRIIIVLAPSRVTIVITREPAPGVPP